MSPPPGGPGASRATGEVPAGGPRPAVFLDRDGTVIEHVSYLSDPGLVRLLPGAAAALIRLRRAGFAAVLATNQSAVGRGMITEGRLREIHAELERQLGREGTSLDGIYYCPDAPWDDDGLPATASRRKPGAGMLLEAASDLGLDLAASWMIGDLMSDVLAGLNAGCRSILLAPGRPPEGDDEGPAPGPYLTAPDLAAAADLILAGHAGAMAAARTAARGISPP
ncbi:D-glycero-beta-D-manno-heptose-1,7-bisphosphate 7-phosphatase (plasmid) [Aquisphaera giovannonii]|uniref:D,D-heptose 1,7-bisphosphate phosphatase n=1 Tax=Aquisphaera giovannonii TaxID=406548 RepID=A0A5B9WG25_9BACT|nr:HAD family hydrolase [Aquisphaera giovannonii]QEH39229.1 D-glycero-beta-D-manno-heptose-1,7-bisphosphate 7-phosphatase [Aquisphaera giovannonii]